MDLFLNSPAAFQLWSLEHLGRSECDVENAPVISEGNDAIYKETCLAFEKIQDTLSGTFAKGNESGYSKKLLSLYECMVYLTNLHSHISIK
jgi:hypothetical protein